MSSEQIAALARRCGELIRTFAENRREQTDMHIFQQPSCFPSSFPDSAPEEQLLCSHLSLITACALKFVLHKDEV